MSRFGSIAVWVLQFVLAAFFAVQGAVKLAGSQNWVFRFNGWGYPDGFYLVVGLAELSGAIVLLIPRLAKFGALLLIAVMVGATATHHPPRVAGRDRISSPGTARGCSVHAPRDDCTHFKGVVVEFGALRRPLGQIRRSTNGTG